MNDRKSEATGQTPELRKQRKSKTWLWWILGGILAAALIMFLCIGIRTAKSTANQALDAVEAGDAEKIVQLMPEALVQSAEGGRQQYGKDYQDRLDRILQTASVTCSLGEHKTVSTDNFGNLIKYYQEYYQCTLNIQKVIHYDLRVFVGGVAQQQTIKLTVMKVDGKWYLDRFSLDHLLFLLESKISPADIPSKSE